MNVGLITLGLVLFASGIFLEWRKNSLSCIGFFWSGVCITLGFKGL